MDTFTWKTGTKRTALFILVSFLALFFTEAGFRRIRLTLLPQHAVSSGNATALSFPSEKLATSSFQRWILEIRITVAKESRKVPLFFNDRPVAEIDLRSGESRFQRPIGEILSESENKISIPLSLARMRIEAVEIKNCYGYSVGPCEVFLVGKSLIPIHWRQNRTLVFLVFLAFLFLLHLLYSRIGHEAARLANPLHPWRKNLFRSLAFFSFLLILSPLAVTLFSDRSLLISRHTFLLLWAGVGIFSLYSRGIPLHKTLLQLGKNFCIPRIRDLQAHGIDRRYVIHVLLLPALFLTLFLISSFAYYTGSFQEKGDDAVYALQIERAKHFDEWVGPYSRFEFHHPGPISFYTFALTEKIFPFLPSPMARHAFGQLFLNLFFLLLALHITYFAFPHRSSAPILFFWWLASLALPPFGGDVFSRTWPPNLLLFPMLVFVLAIAKISFGELRFVLPAALSFTFIFQNSVSSSAIVFPFALASLILFLWNKKKHSLILSGKDKKALVLGTGMLLVAFILPLVEQFTSHPGNITRIFNFFSSQKGAFHTFADAGDFVFDYFKAPWGYFLGVNSLIWIAVLSFVAFLSVKKERLFQNYLVIYVLAGIVLSVIGAMRVPDRLMFYILLYLLAFVALLHFVCTLSILERIRLSGIQRQTAFAFLAAFVCLITVRFYRNKPDHAYNPRYRYLVNAIQPVKGPTYELFLKKYSLHHQQWGVVAGVALEMVRRGYAVVVPAEWGFMFGNKMVLKNREKEVKRVAFYESSNSPAPARQKKASYGDTVIEFGDPILLSIPLRLDKHSSDEYFADWRCWQSEYRFFMGDRATVTFPLDKQKISAGQRCLLEIRAKAAAGKRYRLIFNGHPLPPLTFDGSYLKASCLLEPYQILPGKWNTLVIEDMDPPAPSSAPPYIFNLDRIDISLESVGMGIDEK